MNNHRNNEDHIIKNDQIISSLYILLSFSAFKDSRVTDADYLSTNIRLLGNNSHVDRDPSVDHETIFNRFFRSVCKVAVKT